jgi:hypothetical protein
MQKKHHEIQMLFKSLTGKSVVRVPITKEPSEGYWPAKNTERYYR